MLEEISYHASTPQSADFAQSKTSADAVFSHGPLPASEDGVLFGNIAEVLFSVL